MESVKEIINNIKELETQRKEIGSKIDEEYSKIGRKFTEWFEEYMESLDQENPEELEKYNWMEDHSICDSATIILAMLIDRHVEIPEEWTYENYRKLYDLYLSPIDSLCDPYLPQLECLEEINFYDDMTIGIYGEFNGDYADKELVLKDGDIVCL